jgi:hypothetical protein
MGRIVLNIRTATGYALLVLFFTCAAASPAPTTSWTSLTTRAQAIDTAAQRGDWTSAQRLSHDLLAQWTAKRPTALHSLKGKAFAESFDASLKWISGAIAQRDAQNVHQAVAHAERTVHELAERRPSTK